MANRLSEKCGNRPAPESAVCYLYDRLESHKKKDWFGSRPHWTFSRLYPSNALGPPAIE